MEGQRHSRIPRCDIQGSSLFIQVFVFVNLSQAVHALVDPGDPVLIEKPVYAYVRGYILDISKS